MRTLDQPTPPERHLPQDTEDELPGLPMVLVLLLTLLTVLVGGLALLLALGRLLGTWLGG